MMQEGHNLARIINNHTLFHYVAREKTWDVKSCLTSLLDFPAWHFLLFCSAKRKCKTTIVNIIISQVDLFNSHQKEKDKMREEHFSVF